MIVGWPGATPVTIPDVPTVASAVLLLLHAPPPASVKVLVKPTHTVAVPEIADGSGLTVIVLVIIQPEADVYVIRGLPLATPVTTPVADATVASVILLLLHVPPDGVEFNVVVAATHSTAVPVIAVGIALTLTACVIKQPVANE